MAGEQYLFSHPDNAARRKQLDELAKRHLSIETDPERNISKLVHIMIEVADSNSADDVNRVLEAERTKNELFRVLAKPKQRDGSEFGKLARLISLFVAMWLARSATQHDQEQAPSPQAAPPPASDNYQI